MSIQQTTIKASTLLTVLCLSSALAMTSCGKKTATETTQTTTKTETAAAPTTGASTAPAATTAAPAAGAGGALSAVEKNQLTPIKTALVMANSAIKSGDIAKAKTQFAKFSSAWPAVEPIVKAKAGASYPAISSGIEMVKTAMGSATPDKAKAAEGLTATIKAMNTVIDKK
jgi:iron uptake system EfeUOB component EfeO/EfeM